VADTMFEILETERIPGGQRQLVPTIDQQQIGSAPRRMDLNRFRSLSRDSARSFRSFLIHQTQRLAEDVDVLVAAYVQEVVCVC
jgi:hypothetical protein